MKRHAIASPSIAACLQGAPDWSRPPTSMAPQVRNAMVQSGQRIPTAGMVLPKVGKQMFTTLVAALALLHDPQAARPVAPLVSIEVHGDGEHYPDHQILIAAESPGLAPTSDGVLDRVWVATRTVGGQSRTVSSDDCPAVASVVAGFADLPAIPISPMILQHGSDLAIGPVLRGGYATTLRFSTRMPDATFAQVEVRGGTFHNWGHKAVRELQDCWGPAPQG